MAAKTKAVLESEKNNTLASGSNITAAEHRALLTDVIDSYENFIGSYTTVQILAIASPTLRQIVFDTDYNTYYFWDGTRWVEWSRPKYKVYVALLTQTGVNAPVATVLENTLGGTVVWSYNDVGEYIGTLTGGFTNNKTLCMAQQDTGNTGIPLGLSRENDNTVLLKAEKYVIDGSDIITEGIDEALSGASINIRVYY